MAITSVRPFVLWSSSPAVVDTSGSTIDAVGESAGAIGYLRWDGGGTHTLSAAGGGAIWTRVAGTTFVNGTTVVKVGVQDVDTTTGLEDGTFDVNASISSGTWIAGAAWQQALMGTGSKSMAQGDIIAIVMEMTARGGADSISARTWQYNTGNNSAIAFPYGSVDTGALAKTSPALMAVIIADDGTVGWIDGFEVPTSSVNANTAFNQTSSPDEYAAAFRVQVPTRVEAFLASIYNVANVDTFEALLYSDPYGTPTVVDTCTVADLDLQRGATGLPTSWWFKTSTARTLTAGTDYCFAIRATSNNNINYGYTDHSVSGSSVIKPVNVFGSFAKVITRTDQTGAFSELGTRYWPLFAMLVTGLDDGSGSGSAARPRNFPLGVGNLY